MSDAPEIQAPNAEVIEILSGLLLDAELGALVGVAIVAIHPDGSVATCWKGTASDDLFRLLGGLRYLESRIVQSIDTPVEDDE